MHLTSRVATVTGAASRIVKEIARRLAEKGGVSP
jgi:NAD(P)-dependent dehydrogenase (short-subunit alcohol dehydrogenase family)